MKIFTLILFITTSLFAAEKIEVLNNVHPYKDNYFIAGAPNAKFQFSFKVNILRQYDWYFAYTQTAFWDIFKNSTPFEDINFSPETFYRFKSSSLNHSVIDFGIYQHLSNGKDGVDSRSFDRSYIRLISSIKLDNEMSFIMKNKFQAIYNQDKYNKDIGNYYGFYEFTIKIKDFFKFAFKDEELYFRYAPGKDFLVFSDRKYGNYNLGFSFSPESSKIFPTFLIDFFSGLGETLLNYKNKSHKLRVGLVKRF